MNRQDPRYSMAVQMLTQELPKLHPSALKHAYLASVANVINHPIAELTKVDQRNPNNVLTHIYGWTSYNRRVPLEVIMDEQGMVFHAFVPHPKDRVAMQIFQHDENIYVSERGVEPRNIKENIERYSRDGVAEAGIDPYPKTVITEKEIQNLLTDGWYPTTFIHEDTAIDVDGSPDIDYQEDNTRLKRNIIRSINGARTNHPRAGKPDPFTNVNLIQERSGRLGITGVPFTRPTPPRPRPIGSKQFRPKPPTFEEKPNNTDYSPEF